MAEKNRRRGPSVASIFPGHLQDAGFPASRSRPITIAEKGADDSAVRMLSKMGD